jgi:hypothetical protein
MQTASHFAAYAAAFERAYDDDDWTRLEAFFTPDATYVVTGGPPLGGRWAGRSEVIAQLRSAVNELDRRFDKRRVEAIGEPEISDTAFEMGWRATYEKTGCPDLVIGGQETATFEGPRIVTLVDEMHDGVDESIQGYLARYFE